MSMSLNGNKQSRVMADTGRAGLAARCTGTSAAWDLLEAAGAKTPGSSQQQGGTRGGCSGLLNLLAAVSILL